MAWRCRFLTARPSQDGHVIAEKKILVKNCRVHPTHWLISTQLTTPSARAAFSKSCVEIKFRAPHAIDAIFSP
jgi:hypothetical protein